MKIHRVNQFSAHSNFGTNGNQILKINDYPETKLVNAMCLSVNYNHLISGLIVDKNHSGFIGYSETHPKLKKTVQLLLEILENHK